MVTRLQAHMHHFKYYTSSPSLSNTERSVHYSLLLLLCVCVCVPRLYSKVDGSSESNQVDFSLVKDGDLLI